MSVLITYTVDCGNCGEEATSTTLDLSNPQPDGTLRIDLEMAAGQAEFTCDDCGATVYTDDLNTTTEGGSNSDEDDCDGDDTDTEGGSNSDEDDCDGDDTDTESGEVTP